METIPRNMPSNRNKEVMAQAKFIHVDGIGLVMAINEFNEFINKFDLKKKGELGRALYERREDLNRA